MSQDARRAAPRSGPAEPAEPAADPSGAREAPGEPLPPDPHWGKDPSDAEERVFLEGPRARGFELVRALRIFAEFIRGFRGLHFTGPCVTVFGSARFGEEHRYYVMARELGRRLGQAGFGVMTGGGPGIMEAANRGARDVRAVSIGCNIKLPREQQPNRFLDRWVDFRYFFVRKVMLVKYSYAFVALPGGFGTLDEIFETATLVQTGKIRDFPIVLMGRDYWQPLIDFLRTTLVAEGTIDAIDVDRLLVTDDPDEAVAHIIGISMRDLGLRRTTRPPRRSRFLFESGSPKERR